jgi:hypothetical protein
LAGTDEPTKEEEMKSSRHNHLFKLTALAAVGAALAATSAQAGAPPADPGWELFPHCTVPQIEGTLLGSAKKELVGSLCGYINAPVRTRSAAARNTVLVSVPEAGTILAPGTKVLLIVSK